MNHDNYEKYRNSLTRQLLAEREKDNKDYNKRKREIENAHDTISQILKSNTKPDGIREEDRNDYLNAAIDSVNNTRSQKLKTITHILTQQNRIFMILKYHQDHDPYYAPAKKLSRTRWEINKINKKIADDKTQLTTLNITINEQQKELAEINARIKEVLLSTPNTEICDIIQNKLTEIKLDKRIIKNIKKAILATSRNENGIIIINKKHRDDWFKESKDFKLQDWILEILWEFLIQVEWHSSNPNPMFTDTSKQKIKNTTTQQKITDKSEKEKSDEQTRNKLKKRLEDLQNAKEPNIQWYIKLYQKIFKYKDSQIDKLARQFDEAFKQRTDLRTAIESDLLQRLDVYPQPVNLDKLKWTDYYRISFCNSKRNLLLSWDFKIIWLLSYDDYKKFQKNN